MSTQLILYPQTYEGQYNLSSTLASEKIVDGISFSTINASPLADVPSNSPLPVIGFAQPIIVNSWYRSRSTLFGTPAAPSAAGNYLYLYSVASSTTSGVYQKLSNLTIGQWYNLYVVWPTTGASGDIFLAAYNGNNAINISNAQYTISSLSGNFAFLQFQAETASDIVQINYTNTVADTFKIADISVVPLGVTPSFGTFSLDDGQVICDLYQEEDIPLTLSIDDFKNVAEQVQSYSKDFSLPATKRNNQIFNNMFEVTRADDGLIFNPYVKTQCVLKQDGFILFQGYLRMLDVKDQEGEISYSVNLYSEVIALAETLKDRTFSDLDFSELDHEYTKSNIRASWNSSPSAGITYINPSTSGFRNANNTVKYPFINWTGSIIITTNTNTASGPTPDNPELTTLEQAFRPCIQLKYLINRIFAASGFNWTSNFFNSADFGDLYMDFNWGSDNFPVQSVSNATNTFSCNGGQGTHYAGTSYTNFVLDDTGIAFFFFPPNYDDVTNIITATAVNETYNINYDYNITNTDSVTRTVEARYLKNSTPFHYSGVITLAAGASYVYQGNLNISLDPGDTLQAQFKASSAGVVQQAIGGGAGFSFGTNVIFILGATSITTSTILQTLRGELGQWEFLKGIMTMFNLVSMVDESNPNNLIFEPYSDVFIKNINGGNASSLTLADRGVEYDWTDKVDVSELQLTPLTDLNKTTVFQFVEDDDDYVFRKYKNITSGHLYGSKIFDASTSSNGLPTILQGVKEIIAEPFAATASSPLSSQFANFIVPSIYTKNDDGTSEGFDNSPRIFYNNGIKGTGASYYIPEQNGGTSENQTNFLQFSHLSDITTIAGTRDFVFESSQLFSPIGGSPTNNLFNNYWLPYYAELYNADTRLMTLKVNLTPSDINVFKMTDTIFIKNRSFRVNKIEYKPNDLATVEFILIP